MSARRVRIGVDTGGTFTDVVAVDEETGAIDDDQDAVHARRPGRRLPRPASARCSAARRSAASAITAVSHGTTVATNQLLEGRLDRIGFITTEGYESVLEIARQSVPDGYGNSYFWVKPPRIVPGRPGAHRRAGGSTTPARRSGRSTRRRRRRRPLLPRRRRRHPRRLLPALLRERRARAADARGDRASTPAPSSRSLRCCASTGSTSAR